MAKYGNENAAAGGRSKDTAGRDRSYGGSSKGGGSDKDKGRTPSKAGNSTVADHMIATGRISAPSIPSGGVGRGNYPTQDDAYDDYARSVGQYDTRGWLGKAVDKVLGGFYDENEPMAGNPRSFSGGDWHSSTNPGGVLGGIAGMFAGPAGFLAGPLGSMAYNAAGLPQAWHGGYDQPDVRSGIFGNSDSPLGGTMADARNAVANGGVNTASGKLSGTSNVMAGGGRQGNNEQRENSNSSGLGSIPRLRPTEQSVVKNPQTAADASSPMGLVQMLYDQYYPSNIPNYNGPGQTPTSYNTWDDVGGMPQMTQNAAPQAPTSLQPPGTFNPGQYGRAGGEMNFLADKKTPGSMKTMEQLLRELGMARGGIPHPQGHITGPGGPKDDAAGLFSLSNNEYVLPVEMVKHFGGGNINHGIGRLEALRRKVLN